jgi:hypothetical protein
VADAYGPDTPLPPTPPGVPIDARVAALGSSSYGSFSATRRYTKANLSLEIYKRQFPDPKIKFEPGLFDAILWNLGLALIIVGLAGTLFVIVLGLYRLARNTW